MEDKKSGKGGKLFAQIMKFAVVGGLSFLIDFVIYTIAVKLIPGRYDYLIAGVLGYGISLIFNYLASMAFVFERREGMDRRKEFLIFAGLSLVGLLLNTVFLWLYKDIMYGLWPWFNRLHELVNDQLIRAGLGFFKDGDEFAAIMAKIFATALVMVYNFISRKMTLEKKDESDENAADTQAA